MAEAIKWYRKASVQGNADASTALNRLERQAVTVQQEQSLAAQRAREEEAAEAARQKEAERKARAELLAEERAIANMPSRWSKAECIRAASNFGIRHDTNIDAFYIHNPDISASADSVRAADLSFALKGLSTCGQRVALTYEEQKQLSTHSQFVSTEGEQEFLMQHFNGKIMNYMQRHDLQFKYESELVKYNYDAVLNHTVQLSDGIAFMNRHALMKDFYIEDDSQFDKLDISERVKALHVAELLLGLVR